MEHRNVAGEIKDEIRLMHEIINSLPTLQRTIMRMKDIEEYERKRSPRTSQAVIRKPSEVTCRERERVREIYLQTVQEK